MTSLLTYQILLIIQAVHLLHHRIAKRHISFVEGLTALVLCLPPVGPIAEWVPAWLLMGAHGVLGLIQVIGSVFIKKLSPDWSAGPSRRDSLQGE